MISSKMTAAINQQINRELYSGYLYMAMSARATALGLPGVANWFYVQTKEEMSHALKMYQYVNSQGQEVELIAIDQPEGIFNSALDMFQAGLEHERKVTAWINELVDLAQQEKDHATEIFLQWFVTEQVEEEENASDILGKLKLAGDGGGLFMIDKELQARTFTAPTGMVL